MARGRTSFGLLLSAGLVLLVGVLAALQYRWLGSVSDAERARLHASLQQRAEDFAHDLDRQVAVVYKAFQNASEPLGSGDVAEFASRYERWRASAGTPLVRGLYRMTPDRQLLQFHVESQSFRPVEWPSDLLALRARASTTLPLDAPTSGNEPLRRGMPGARASWSIASTPFVSSAPALVVPIPSVKTLGPAGQRAIFEFRVNTDALVIWLDRKYLQTVVLPSLADRYFPVRAEDFHLAVVDAHDPADVVFARGVPAGTSIDAMHADATLPLVSLRPELIALPAEVESGHAPNHAQALVRVGPTTSTAAHTSSAPPQRVNIYVEQHTTSTTGRMVASFRAIPEGGWTLVVQHASGSLDTLVAQGRRRNLLLSFGILALLGVSVGLIVINAQRSQRLASQQMDFVAAVSHELRTPLAVIQSAAQNLSAGVISDPARAQQYGELIDAEGRRLTDMVEQILQFAGLAGARSAPQRAVNAADIVREAAASCATLATSAGLNIELDVRTQGLVNADGDGLRRAVANLIGNGIKYAAAGGWIQVSVRKAAGAQVQIRVSDRGPGIDPEDLPHLFEPFYRGRHARDRQIRGNGLGLALVKGVVDAHRGRVTVESALGQGATFTLHLPAADPAASALDD